MRNYDIIKYKDENGNEQTAKIQYINITPSHSVLCETIDGDYIMCYTKDIISLECDKRETMM